MEAEIFNSTAFLITSLAVAMSLQYETTKSLTVSVVSRIPKLVLTPLRQTPSAINRSSENENSSIQRVILPAVDDAPLHRDSFTGAGVCV
jgi:hypothetical protein